MLQRSRTLPAVLLSIALGACSSDDEPAKTDADTSTPDTTSDTAPAPTDTTADPTDTAEPTPDPGALLLVTMDATVGVLLDELPEAARARVVAMLQTKPESFWQERARRQIDMTSYRLIFRNFYYEPEELKHILPLPPVETWRIQFGGPPTLREIDGHQLVVRDYTFTGTLLGPEDEAVKSDARLDAPGATVEEEFVLPVDPEHIFERTAYACMDEADFPPNSVDTENARLFYDDLCEGGVTIDNDGCHLSYPIPDDSCVDAVKKHVGSVATAVRFERLAWDDAVADAVRVGTQLPGVSELRAMPEGVADNRIVYRYFAPDSCAIAEGCVGGPGWRRLLQFTATVQNLGAVDAALGDVSEGSGPVENRVVSLSECHGHMHFNHYGKFTFGQGDQQLGSKRAFCLESTWRYYNNEDTPFTHPYTCQYQGTAAGWGDDYIAGLDCQWVDVTTIDTTDAPHVSTLGFHVNPDKFLCEGTVKTDEAGEILYEPTEFLNEAGETESRIACEERPDAASNNVATAEVTLPAGTGGLVTAPCTRGQIGPTRNCGFAAPAAAVSCTPGAAASFTCSGGTSAQPVAMRVCEGSGVLGAIPCTYLDALASATAVGEELKVAFTCPSARDADGGEAGGLVGVFLAPHVDGDAVDVSCTLD